MRAREPVREGPNVGKRTIEQLLQVDLSTGTEAFRDALLKRCLEELGADGEGTALDDAELEMLAAAGAPDAPRTNDPHL